MPVMRVSTGIGTSSSDNHMNLLKKEVLSMKGQTYVILSIIFVIIISVFAVLNIDQVKVNYLFWSGSSPLIFVILFSVLLGGVLTTAVGSTKYITLKRENKRLRDMMRKLEVESDSEEDLVRLETKAIDVQKEDEAGK